MRNRLGTPGIAVMLAGLALLYWGTGILRGGNGGPKIIRRGILGPKTAPLDSEQDRGKTIPKGAE